MDYLEIIRQAEEAHHPVGSTNKTGGMPTRSLRAPSVKPGDRIIWGTEGTRRGPATVDFLHTDPDGTVWAFYTLSDENWGAVNLKFVTVR